MMVPLNYLGMIARRCAVLEEVRMKKLFLIGGMGAGKSTARKALTDEGLAWIDLDQVGHEVLTWGTVKDDLRGAFKALSSISAVIRRSVALAASTRVLA